MSAEPNPDKTFILMDNGLLRRVYNKTDGDAVFSVLYSKSKELGFPDIRGQEAVVTPFSLLEAIGIGKLPSVSDVPLDMTDVEKAQQIATKIAPTRRKLRVRLKELGQSGKDADTDEQVIALRAELRGPQKGISELIENFRTIQFTKYREIFSNAPELSPETLQRKFQDQYEWLSKVGKEAFDLFFKKHIQTKKDTDHITQFVAFDAVYKFEWPKALRIYRDVHVFADLFRSLKDDVGVMQTRGLKYVWHNLAEEFIEGEEWVRLKRTEEEFRKEIAEATDAIDLKTREDLLDTEMLQFLVTGKIFQEKFAPVYVYTLEGPDKFISRIALIKMLINSSREAMKPAELDLPEFSPGVVAFVAADGTVSRFVRVNEVTPFLADR